MIKLSFIIQRVATSLPKYHITQTLIHLSLVQWFFTVLVCAADQYWHLPMAHLAKSGPDIYYFRRNNPKQCSTPI